MCLKKAIKSIKPFSFVGNLQPICAFAIANVKLAVVAFRTD
jgi:hypothetical protein